jgi:hypothetical protein
MNHPEKLEIIYYEMVQMEKRLTEKAQIVLSARDEITSALNRFEILQKELISELQKSKLR